MSAETMNQKVINYITGELINNEYCDFDDSDSNLWFCVWATMNDIDIDNMGIRSEDNELYDAFMDELMELLPHGFNQTNLDDVLLIIEAAYRVSKSH